MSPAFTLPQELFERQVGEEIPADPIERHDPRPSYWAIGRKTVFIDHSVSVSLRIARRSLTKRLSFQQYFVKLKPRLMHDVPDVATRHINNTSNVI